MGNNNNGQHTQHSNRTGYRLEKDGSGIDNNGGLGTTVAAVDGMSTTRKQKGQFVKVMVGHRCKMGGEQESTGRLPPCQWRHLLTKTLLQPMSGINTEDGGQVMGRTTMTATAEFGTMSCHLSACTDRGSTTMTSNN
jgi:hypothetical protein